MKGWGALGFCLAAMLALGWSLHGCSWLWSPTPTLQPLHPLPGPNINDWQAHAPDGGGQ